MKFKKLIFDFDGVILNSHTVKTQAFKYVFLKYGKTIANNAKKYHLNNVGKSRYDKFNFILSKYFKKGKYPNIKEIEKNFSNFCDPKISKLKVSKKLLFFFKKKYKKIKFYISTGMPQNKIKKIVKRKGLNKYIIKSYGSPETKINHIKKISKKTEKNNILFIGDSHEDYKSAKKCNINFILKINSENKKLAKTRHIHKIRSFHNFENFINRRF